MSYSYRMYTSDAKVICVELYISLLDQVLILFGLAERVDLWLS